LQGSLWNTSSTVQNASWNAEICSVCIEISQLSCYSMIYCRLNMIRNAIHYRIQNKSPLNHAHNQYNPVNTLIKNSVSWVRTLLSAKLVQTFADRGCHVVSETDLYRLILGFLDQIRYFFFQVAPQLYSRGWVDPVPDPLLLRKCGSARNRTRTSESLARNSDHLTTEAVPNTLISRFINVYINNILLSVPRHSKCSHKYRVGYL
jgi:hypothetical protein